MELFCILPFLPDRVSYFTPINWLTLSMKLRTFIPPLRSKLERKSATFIVSITFRREPKHHYIKFGELAVGELVCLRVVHKPGRGFWLKLHSLLLCKLFPHPSLQKILLVPGTSPLVQMSAHMQWIYITDNSQQWKLMLNVLLSWKWDLKKVTDVLFATGGAKLMHSLKCVFITLGFLCDFPSPQESCNISSRHCGKATNLTFIPAGFPSFSFPCSCLIGSFCLPWHWNMHTAVYLFHTVHPY